MSELIEYDRARAVAEVIRLAQAKKDLPEAVRKAAALGVPKTRLAEVAGISNRTVYHWLDGDE